MIYLRILLINCIFLFLLLFGGCSEKKIDYLKIVNNRLIITSVNKKQIELDSLMTEKVLLLFKEKKLKEKDLWFIIRHDNEWVHPDTIRYSKNYDTITKNKNKNTGKKVYIINVLSNKSVFEKFINKHREVTDSNIDGLLLKSTTKIIFILSNDLSKILYIDMYPENLYIDSDEIEIIK